MHKPWISFLCTIIATSVNCMHLIKKDKDCLSHLTQQLAITHEWDLQ